MRTGVRLALDWGDARIGVAACDAAGTLAYPVETVPGNKQSLDRIAALVAEYEPFEVVVGLPRSLSGGEGPAAAKIRQHALALAGRLSGVQVRLLDERLTTVTAARTLSQRGRKAKQQRAVIDQVAAVTILEQALEAERRTGRPPGELLAETSERGDEA
ncbi:Holliday junction resolvase RuvX [Enemella evansiae]|uniref:Putative pre-16S rRNA nuclease n=1 Tax=Enemella evansiae TaxID=2016499 RepID=A0A255G470_9ACTN|nr:Holliday junction resolvase RuvX [Enemella evansiae]PFG67330.1 putative Holliday junction resolvase [Propionibacteriaceae bacterium ES.041]OYN99134.1 Holliday junction resolvase RuvX [Enemella evansiae]OYO05224.1 Holliday junction resolvase RuvX [Enemella evansiae]OYO10728.1 Holliday junction resolvase RuvX [Enemella evansiae]TDO93198.1 putative Holliday junction resolvase [Enemella evansiae]